MPPTAPATETKSRSTAEAQRSKIVSRAVRVFAHAGYHATPVAQVAAAAGVSPAYVFRLFPGKLALFVSAVEHCYERVRVGLIASADGTDASTPEEILAAMSDAYVDLIRDRDLIMLQVHAQSACDVPEIRAAVQRGLAELVTAVTDASGADSASVQRFVAYGQLCHLIVQADLASIDETWARTLSDGIQHPDDAPTPSRPGPTRD